MVLRSVIGALVTVGVMGAIAAALPERGSGKSPPAAPAPSFGSLAAPPATPAISTNSGDATLNAQERQTLLKLAAFPVSAETAPNSVPAAAQPTSRPSPSAPPVSQAPAPAMAPAIQPAPAQVRTVSITPPAPQPPNAPAPLAVQPPAAPERPTGLININRASVAELDHIPGGGRIGAWIARRRPYRSVEDLVKKRVLREAAFQRIRSSITAD